MLVDVNITSTTNEWMNGVSVGDSELEGYTELMTTMANEMLWCENFAIICKYRLSCYHTRTWSLNI